MKQTSDAVPGDALPGDHPDLESTHRDPYGGSTAVAAAASSAPTSTSASAGHKEGANDD